jgi:hypothetical protein
VRDENDLILRRIARALRDPVRLGSSFDARVMGAIRAMPRHARTSLWSRLTTPRTVTATPLPWGVLAASILLIAMYGAVRAYGDLNRSNSEAAPTALTGRGRDSSARQRVQFVLVAPSARKVAVVGDFNGWDATHSAYQAKHRGGGVWSVTAPVAPGHHRYSFVVDDSVWMADPSAPRSIDNDYGIPNSAIVVGEQQR